MLARPANTVVIDADLDPVLAAPLGCSVQTGVGTVRNALSVGAGWWSCGGGVTPVLQMPA